MRYASGTATTPRRRVGRRLDRHEHIGQGMIGTELFRRLLNDARFAHSAFIAETPVDDPGDDERDVRRF